MVESFVDDVVADGPELTCLVLLGREVMERVDLTPEKIPLPLCYLNGHNAT